MSDVIVSSESEQDPAAVSPLPDVAIDSQATEAGIGAFASAHGLDVEFKERARPDGAVDKWSAKLRGVELDQGDGGASPLSGSGATKSGALQDFMAQASGRRLIAFRDKPNQVRVLAPSLFNDFLPAPIVNPELLLAETGTQDVAPAVTEIAPAVENSTADEPSEVVTPPALPESVPSMPEDHSEGQ